LEDAKYTIYTFSAEAYFIVSSLILTIYGYRKYRGTNQARKIILAGAGTIFFFLVFFSANLAVALLAESDVSTYVYNYQIYGLFGMPVFLVFLGYLVVRYQAFNIGWISSQALLLALVALIGSQFTFTLTLTSAVLTAITLVLTGLVGIILVRSVRREVEQREQIERLAKGLEKANARLQELDNQKCEFVSIASHQLRSPLTAIRGYAAMLMDGSYGNIPAKGIEALQRINESSTLMASSIEDFLNVSRIESGNMKYELSDFNLREQAAHIVDDLRPEAMKVGLVLTYKSDMTAEGIVHADIGKTQQILHNLINNSLKYTPKGSITVLVHENLKYKKLYVEIIDTGIGMSAKTIADLFGKFKRADNANSVNIKGTGLGLFVAREMARAMHGDVTAHSEGDGKGSRFILSLPLIK
jgi:signal transduction histidine kinase